MNKNRKILNLNYSRCSRRRRIVLSQRLIAIDGKRIITQSGGHIIPINN